MSDTIWIQPIGYKCYFKSESTESQEDKKISDVLYGPRTVPAGDTGICILYGPRTVSVGDTGICILYGPRRVPVRDTGMCIL